MEAFPNIDIYTHIHFIGIGGVSMSSLALILKEKGKFITGSDNSCSTNTDMLIKKGIPVNIGHSADNVINAQLVVYTAAIADSNPELVYAKQNNIPIMERAVLLGSLMSDYSKSIAVSGTHGKTTTTSMISSVFLSAQKDPTILIGAHFNQINANYKTGHSDYSVYEACEYVNSFLHFYPHTAVILNIDEDHLDFFVNLDNIKKSFLLFTKNVRENGTIVINGDDDNCKFIIENCNRSIVTFGFSNSCDCYAENVRYNNGKPIFDAIYKGSKITDIELSVLGDHNILNALATVCVAKQYGLDDNNIKIGLSKFNGANRRFEIKKIINGCAIVDDYAHHPKEIRATISGAKAAGYKKITVVFQSHTYTRTKLLINDFAKELSEADQVILTDIYSAREINTIGANILELKDKIQNCLYISSFDEIAQYIKDNTSPNEVIILMGAGNVNTIFNLL